MIHASKNFGLLLRVKLSTGQFQSKMSTVQTFQIGHDPALKKDFEKCRYVLLKESLPFDYGKWKIYCDDSLSLS